MDVWSRRIVGWALHASLREALVLDALQMAVVHHSDQGSQYTSIAFGQRCVEADVRPSMGSARRLLRQCDGRELLRDH